MSKHPEHTKYTEFPKPFSDEYSFRMLAGVVLSDEESVEARKYFKENKGGPATPEKERYMKAFEDVQAEMPKPENDRERRLYFGAQTLGYICAMQDAELFWRLQNLQHRRSGNKKRREKHEPRQRRISNVYLAHRRILGELEARRQTAKQFKMSLRQVNRVLDKRNLR